MGPTEHEAVSRITVIADAEGPAMEQVTKQLNKLVNVLKIVELDPATSVGRELYLVKVRADDSNRTAVLQIVDLFRAHVVDVSPTSVVIETVGSESKVKALLESLGPTGSRRSSSPVLSPSRAGLGPSQINSRRSEINHGS